MIYQIRNGTKLEDISYALHLYFNGLSLRNTAKALSRFVHRSHTLIRDWIQKYKPKRLFCRQANIAEFIIDETQLKVGSELIWLWVAIDPKDREILSITISKERNMFVVAERFLSNFLKECGKHPISTDGDGTWYPHQVCQFLKLKYHLHSTFEKSIFERAMQYIKDRTAEGFDDYFPCSRKTKCKLKHVQQWLSLL